MQTAQRCAQRDQRSSVDMHHRVSESSHVIRRFIKTRFLLETACREITANQRNVSLLKRIIAHKDPKGNRPFFVIYLEFKEIILRQYWKLNAF